MNAHVVAAERGTDPTVKMHISLVETAMDASLQASNVLAIPVRMRMCCWLILTQEGVGHEPAGASPTDALEPSKPCSVELRLRPMPALCRPKHLQRAEASGVQTS